MTDPVALRKESVDRNKSRFYYFDLSRLSLSARRAWIEIGLSCIDSVPYQSLSARRAWKEIVEGVYDTVTREVALRKESVDRNHDDMLRYRDAEQSLSARRAWIEIYNIRIHQKKEKVALRKESVDRNAGVPAYCKTFPVALRKESVDRNRQKLAEAIKPS